MFITKEKKQKLNIEFHNPNKMEDVIHELVKISAEIVKTKVEQKLLGQALTKV